VFLDESGYLMQPVRHRTWAPRGHTPVQRVATRHHRRLSSIGALALSAQRQRVTFYFQLVESNVATDQLIWFLTEMHRHLGRKIILVWDNLNPHRSAAAWFTKHHPDWFRFEWLPPYSPELNPVEGCWSHSKYHELGNYCADNLDQLYRTVQDTLTAKRNDQHLLKSWFAHAGLKL
jgi:transposase